MVNSQRPFAKRLWTTKKYEFFLSSYEIVSFDVNKSVSQLMLDVTVSYSICVTY